MFRRGQAGRGSGSSSSTGLVRPQRDDLLCRNGCGFFGNPEWQWYCSKCWREHQGRSGAGLTARAAKTSPQNEPFSASWPSPKQAPKSEGVASKEGKHSAKNLRSLLGLDAAESSSKGSLKDQQKSGKGQPEKATAKEGHQQPLSQSPEVKAAGDELAAFLDRRLGKQGVVDVSRKIKGLHDKLGRLLAASSPEASADELSNLAQEFYSSMRRHLQTAPIYQGISADDQDAILDLCEKFTLLAFHKDLFCLAGTNDEEKDLETQVRVSG